MWFPGFCLKGIPMWNQFGLWCDFMWWHGMTSRYDVTVWRHIINLCVSQQTKGLLGKSTAQLGNTGGMWTLRRFHWNKNLVTYHLLIKSSFPCFSQSFSIMDWMRQHKSHSNNSYNSFPETQKNYQKRITGKLSWISHSFIHSFACLFICSFVLSFVHLFIHSFVHSFVHSFIHSFIQVSRSTGEVSAIWSRQKRGNQPSRSSMGFTNRT